jgi:hypothetical protein
MKNGGQAMLSADGAHRPRHADWFQFTRDRGGGLPINHAAAICRPF